MSLFPPRFQIHSDLHLETPLTTPSYPTFPIPIHANNLFLLGDIGLVKDEALFLFLERLLETHPPLKIFYILGNHEAYQITHSAAVQKMRDFEEQMKIKYGERFIFLHRSRYDLSPKLTILGCTLWSCIADTQAAAVYSRLTDFHPDRGIKDWSLESHLAEHEKDLNWLNEEIARIRTDEPEREIVMLTHHSPTMHPKANRLEHLDSEISSGFVTDLKGEVCWLSETVKMWAFGHTHWSCEFWDEWTGKLVVANQKGYSGVEGEGGAFKVKVVEAGMDGGPWKVVDAVEGRRENVDHGKHGIEDNKNREVKVSEPKVSTWRKVRRCFFS